jgi:hypothetical protein
VAIRSSTTGRTRVDTDSIDNAEAGPVPAGQPIPSSHPESPGVPREVPQLFDRAALGRAAGIAVDVPPSEGEGFRPRHGVGAIDGRGGIGVADFLAEDAARERARKGMVPPSVREVERALDKQFAPPFAHVDVSNRRELLHKQFMARLRSPPKTRELARGLDPSTETNRDKVRSTAQAYFLGRRVLVFARQRADGSLVELMLREGSGYRAFDDDALDAVEKALAGRRPHASELKDGEVRTLWRLEATGYVVYSATPELRFDEATGKSEWIYPLEKRVDKSVHLEAVY